MGKRRIEIMDTTLRDGEQTSGVSFPSAEKLTIAKFFRTSGFEFIRGRTDDLAVVAYVLAHA